MPVEQVAGSAWNRWPDVHGIAGRITAVRAGKQCCRAVTVVVVRAPLDLPHAHRQHRLRAIKCLYLALFIDTDDERILRRAQVKSDDVAYFLDELRIRRELERFAAMRLQ